MEHKIYIYNTFTNKKELFIPLENNKIKMYVCGITPYDETHIGHARCYIVFDVIRRYFLYRGYEVKYVQNFTDIDDKIINKSKETGKTTKEISYKYISEFLTYSNLLNIIKADIYPRVTEEIPAIISAINKLIDKGFAYEKNGNVYFSVKKFNNYGKLSKKNIDELQNISRIEHDENKKDILDFALWKARKDESEPFWESPWGKGRPGWHIECSVMSTKYLSETIDIHGGGYDLIFPHHENEIAQTESLTGKQFVRYWIHNGFVTVKDQKMSKSLKNFFTLKDIFKEFKPQVLRYFLISQHYRTHLDFSKEKIIQANTSLSRMKNTYKNIKDILKKHQFIPKTSDNSLIKKYTNDFESAMDDDFNTELAIGHLHRLCGFLNKEMNKREEQNIEILSSGIKTLKLLLEDVLGITVEEEKIIDADFKKEIEKLIEEREFARKKHDWEKSDEIRRILNLKGIIVEDTPQGQRWYIKS